jgi:HD-GYP domain-containing protein (c-di-GMP phosphodiesterase class II)
VSQFLEFTRLDTGLLPTVLKFREVADDYLFHHGINTALLSMSAASELALPPEVILEIGLGSMMQDIGMMRVPDDIRFAPRTLTPEEREEVNRHPLYTLKAIESLDEISQATMMISYQCHERGDCTGYPRRRHRTFIHPYARLVSAIDAYSAITSHRPHRNGRGPYEAMELMLRETSRGKFDPNAMRTMLNGMSLFPVGSYVRLTDGALAKVLRANPGLYTRPIVLVLNTDGNETDSELDLSRVDNIRVMEALNDVKDGTLKFVAPEEK